ncbi:MAG: hypothetical protein ACI9XO_002844 [Paraglaciecola sp.]|jgi:hypothetical protein
MIKREDILKNILKPHFKKNGFKTGSNHFKKLENGFIKVVNPQFSQFNYLSEIKFTFNIGFYFPITVEFEEETPPKSISIHDCQINERFGQIFRDTDYWIEFNLEKGEQEFIKEIQEQIEQITNWLEQLNSLQSLLVLKKMKNTWTTFSVNYHVGISKINDSRFEALKILEEDYLLLENKDTYWSDYLQKAIDKISNLA